MKPYPFSNYPLEILFRKPFTKGWEKFRMVFQKARSKKRELRGFSDHGPMSSFLSRDGDLGPWSIDLTPEERDFLLDAYTNGRFDILGSGWMDWGYANGARGLEGRSHDRRTFFRTPSKEERISLLREEHREMASSILGLLSDPEHSPIDHQRDLKSGFRWDESLPASDQGRLQKGYPGADPKVPFELGRFQHLPRMALLSMGGEERKGEAVRAFRDQVLEFIAMNPPGMGIQWTCSMDVGIRTANLLLAYDLFRTLDEERVLDEPFHRCFSDSIQQHAAYLEQNLEYQDGLTGNHYLFNIAGLLFVSAYMPEAPGSDRRLGFALQESIRELFKQFFPQGGNFEGSTAYHRLSTEMFVYSSALILGLKERLRAMGWARSVPLSKWSHGISGSLRSTAENPLPDAFLERLQQAMQLNRQLTKPNGQHARIGDEDSGVFFRLTPHGTMRSGKELKELYVERAEPGEEGSTHFDEDLLSMRGTNSAIEGLLMEAADERRRWEERLVRAFRKGSEGLAFHRSEGESFPRSEGNKSSEPGHEKFHRISFPKAVDLSQGEWHGDPEAGWYIFRTSELFFLINAPPGHSLRHTWGHVHNDRTGMELQVHGRDLLIDPGSYVYGALPEWRNAFRSVRAHNVPIVEGKEEQNRWPKGGKGLFILYPESRCELLDLGDRSIRVRSLYRGVEHIREASIDEEGLSVRDLCDHSFEVNFAQKAYHAMGYGKRTKKTPL